MNGEKFDKMDPLSITESLGIKTFRKSSRHIWSSEEDAQLTQYLLSITGRNLRNIDAELVDWDLLASRLSKDGSRKPKDYKKRWTTSLDPNVKKGKWTKEEDEQLIQAYEKFGASWQKVAASIRSRTMDQCAKRYTEVLDPKTKDRLDPWTEEEELLLIKQVGIHGTKWRTVASHFENRPALTCRNRWRKIVLSVVRDKADPFIKQEVEKITRSKSMGLENGIVNSTSHKSGNNNNNNNNSTSSSNSNNSNSTNNNNTSNSSSPTLLLRQDSHKDAKIITEWKYLISNGSNGPNFLQNGGSIKDENLVQQLVDYAKNNNLEISIHQHVHHHYNPPPHPFNHISNNEFGGLMYDQFDPTSNTTGASNHNNSLNHSGNVNGGNSNSNNGGGSNGSIGTNSISGGITGNTTILTNNQMNLEGGNNNNNNNSHSNGGGVNIPGSRSYFLEPDQQMNRYQHFNYLPPLTEVPKLTSSNSPDTKKYQITTPEPIDSKNGNGNGKEKSLSPFTQAVHLAVERKLEENKRQRELEREKNDINHNKRIKYDSEEDEEHEDGMDFWEQIHNLGELPKFTTSKPVLTHHPLHNTSSATPQPTPGPMTFNKSGSVLSNSGDLVFYDEDGNPQTHNENHDQNGNGNGDGHNNINDDNDAKSTTTTTTLPEEETQNYVYENLLGNFGMIPFNPS